MSALSFDPWALVKTQIENTPAAKPANPANQTPHPSARLAGLAGLAGVASAKRKSELAGLAGGYSGERKSEADLPILPDRGQQQSAVEIHTAELLANAEANPAVRILDPDKASQYFRARAQAEAHAASNQPASIVRLRPSSWSDIRDEPSWGDRCSACHSSRWWIEGVVPRGWRCAVCYPAPSPFGVRWERT